MKTPTGKARWLAGTAIVLWANLLCQQTPWAEESTGGSPAQTLSPASEMFLLGNVVFALFHEFGHAIIRDFDIPLLGLEENSADTIAAVSLVLLDEQHPDIGYGAALGSTALTQALVWKTGLERNSPEVALWAQHQLSAQRYARLICLLYGSSPDRYAWLAEAASMEDIRTDGCEDEWELAERAVIWVRDTYGIAPGERERRPADSIEVSYAPPLNAQEEALFALLKRYELLENVARIVQTRLAFPDRIALKLSHCRTPNAYWDDEYREVVLCYELMPGILSFADRPEVAKLLVRFRADR